MGGSPFPQKVRNQVKFFVYGLRELQAFDAWLDHRVLGTVEAIRVFGFELRFSYEASFVSMLFQIESSQLPFLCELEERFVSAKVRLGRSPGLAGNVIRHETPLSLRQATPRVFVLHV